MPAPEPDDAKLPLEYVQPTLDHLRSVGVNVDAWLAHDEGLRTALTDPEGLSYDAARTLLIAAMNLAQEPALGLFVGARLVASSHGIVGAAAVNSRTVRQALEVVERFAALRSAWITVSHELGTYEGRLIVSELVPLGEVQAPVLESVVLSIKNVLDEITMGACEVHEVVFPFPEPEYAALARDMFGCPVRYGETWAGFTAPIRVLDLPLKLANPAVFDEAARICQRELERIAAHETIAARVRRTLLANQSGFPSLQVVARLLHMTPRTLHRRLVDEGTSFRTVLESVRHTLAIEHVRSKRFSLEDIAYRLGYSDLANFRRAFKRWEGVAPSVYRERAQGN